MTNLPAGTHILSGTESQNLRLFCTSKTWQASDLDAYARLLTNGPLQEIKNDFQRRVLSSSLDSARATLAAIAYGPVKLPIYNFLLQLTVLNPCYRTLYLSTIRWLAQDAKVPVDSADLSGTTAFMWSISTKPYLELEIADILLAAGADVNHRNRYGCVAAAEICMVSDYSTQGKDKACEALKYFLEKGGNCDIVDGDGVTPRRIAMGLESIVPQMASTMRRYSVREDPSARTSTGTGTSTGSSARSGDSPVMTVFTVNSAKPTSCTCGNMRKYKVCWKCVN